MLVRLLVLFALTLFAFSASAETSTTRILIFGNTTRPAHSKIIPVAGKGLSDFFSKNGLDSTFTQDTSFINEKSLHSYRAVIFLDTSEGILNLSQKEVVESYFRHGGGILAIHSSIALGNDWPWFKNLVGTSFKSHLPIHSENVVIMSPAHASVSKNDLSWQQEDEWYEFSGEVDPSVEVVATVREKPISWCREDKTQGRFWYTAMGHSEALYNGSNPSFLKHLLGATTWVLKK